MDTPFSQKQPSNPSGPLDLRALSIGSSPGMVLVTGPTNAPKKIVLYGLLQARAKTHGNIFTSEDPIEHDFRASGDGAPPASGP